MSRYHGDIGNLSVRWRIVPSTHLAGDRRSWASGRRWSDADGSRPQRAVRRVVPPPGRPDLRHLRRPGRSRGRRPGRLRDRLAQEVPAGSGQQPRGMGAHGGAQQRATRMAARLGGTSLPGQGARPAGTGGRRPRARRDRDRLGGGRRRSARGGRAALPGRPPGRRHRRPARGPGGHGEVAAVPGTRPARRPVGRHRGRRERSCAMSELDVLRRLGDQIVPPPFEALRETARRRVAACQGGDDLAVAASVVAVSATTVYLGRAADREVEPAPPLPRADLATTDLRRRQHDPLRRAHGRGRRGRRGAGRHRLRRRVPHRRRSDLVHRRIHDRPARGPRRDRPGVRRHRGR